MGGFLKKFFSCALILSLFAQSSMVFAQSSAQVEVNQLQSCMQEKFQRLSTELTSATGTPIILDSKARLYYSKTLLHVFLMGAGSQVEELKQQREYYTLLVSVGMLGTLTLVHPSSPLKKISSSMAQEYPKIRPKIIRLAQSSSEERWTRPKGFYRLDPLNFKILTGVLTLSTLISTYFLVQTWLEFNEAHQFYDPSNAGLIRLQNAKQESEFNQSLLSNDPLVTLIRRYALETCKKADINLVLSTIGSLVQSTVEQRQAVYDQVEENFDF